MSDWTLEQKWRISRQLGFAPACWRIHDAACAAPGANCLEHALGV